MEMNESKLRKGLSKFDLKIMVIFVYSKRKSRKKIFQEYQEYLLMSIFKRVLRNFEIR